PPLIVTKAAAPKLTLTWSASCTSTDSDYTIYEGILGSFYSHVSRFCSTGGALSKTFTPLAGNTYYLVTPRNATRQGSYGTRSGGSERPAGENACLPQAISSCP